MSTRQYAHDDAPDCPDCGHDIYVGRREGGAGGWRCWFCGEIWDLQSSVGGDA